ncbi:hypothetical protein CXG81DRAFT_28911 [Caulochytrium protostelioides]|uniref:Uncharacterized protein n=1 Tax=Caulochytrium protostelioides TaxID=1555241 RepID=A0A4V1ITU3_9FUNG|nr:hypothetical protein CXG81DRAFT_28911 [Caulochytrium protostelioides]|eukprot:RKO98257.1 hypothetical protein CXG81DRAFT_28911 [Caulochytrium protostelioides]
MAVHRVLPMPTTAGLTPNDLQPGPTHDPDLMAPRVRDAPHVLGHVDAGASLRHPPRLSPSPTLSLSPPAGPARLAHGSRPAADVPPPPPTAAPALAHDSADVGILLKENDAIVETNRNLHAQNRRLIKEVAQQTANVTTAEEALNDVIEEVDDLKEEMAIVRNGYQSTEEELKAVKAMLSQAYIDLEMQQAELRSAREDIGDRDAQMAHLRQSLEQAMAQYTSHVRESAALADGQHHAKQALAQAVATIAEKNEAITLLQKETRVLSDEFDKLQALCARYHENQAGLEGQHAAIVKTNHELSEALAQARLTIEQNRLTEAGLVKQVETLQQRMQAVEASQQAHAADAQAAAKARFAKQQRLLSGQVRVLEDALSEANAAHARTIRDKQSLEAEMEQLAAAGPDEARRVEGAVAALEERLRHVERDRQHLEQRCHSTQQQLLFTEKQHTTERLALATKIQQLEQRTQRTQDDAARAHEQLLESTRHRGELEKALDGCRRKLAQDHAASQAQLAAATQQSDAKRDELQARLAAVEQARDRATQELMHVITQQKVVICLESITFRQVP